MRNRQTRQHRQAVVNADAVMVDNGRLIQTGQSRVVTDAAGHGIHMTIEAPDAAGDGTVPAAASAAQIASYDGCQAGCALTGFDHQNDYNNETIRDVLLDAIVRLIEPVEVDA